jgi:hypothetical protein
VAVVVVAVALLIIVPPIIIPRSLSLVVARAVPVKRLWWASIILFRAPSWFRVSLSIAITVPAVIWRIPCLCGSAAVGVFPFAVYEPLLRYKFVEPCC